MIKVTVEWNNENGFINNTESRERRWYSSSVSSPYHLFLIFKRVLKEVYGHPKPTDYWGKGYAEYIEPIKPKRETITTIVPTPEEAKRMKIDQKNSSWESKRLKLNMKDFSGGYNYKLEDWKVK